VFAFYDLCFTIGAGHFQLPLCLQFAISHDHIDLILLHQELNAPGHFIGNAPAAFDDGGEIGRTGGIDPEVF